MDNVQLHHCKLVDSIVHSFPTTSLPQPSVYCPQELFQWLLNTKVEAVPPATTDACRYHVEWYCVPYYIVLRHSRCILSPHKPQSSCSRVLPQTTHRLAYLASPAAKQAATPPLPPISPFARRVLAYTAYLHFKLSVSQ